MNRTLLKKAISDAQLLWYSCAAMLYAYCWLRVWITSQVDMSQFQGILNNLPEAWQRLSPVPIEHLFSYPARIAIAYEDPIVYLAITVWAVARSSDCISGEIGRGTMELLLAQPVSRLQLLLTSSVVTLIGTALLALVAWSGTWTGIKTMSVKISSPETSWSTPMIGIESPFGGGTQEPKQVAMNELVDAHIFWPAALNLFAFGFFLAGVGTFLSSWDRYRWRTIGIMVGIYVVEMIIEIVGLASEGWSWLKWFTFFSAYEPVVIISASLSNPDYAWSWFQLDDQGQWAAFGPLSYNALLIGLGMLGFVAAALVFARRDLPAPL